jgi:hypothetical protein
MHAHKIVTLLLLAIILVVIMPACGTGGSSNGEIPACPDAVCILGRLLDSNHDNSLSLTEALGAGNP